MDDSIRASTFESGIGFLLILAGAKVLFHTLTNNQYGFHRDELATLDDARHLAWGYVAYPPVTPFFGRISLELFGASLRGFRFFAVLAGAAAVVLTGLTARELGGKRFAQAVAAAAVASAPLSLASSRVMQYVAFDYLAWVLLAYLVVRLLNSDDTRWWLAIGAAIGFGMLTKYTMIFFAAGVVVGVLLTANRRQLRSPWLWCGVAVSLLVFLPNLIWQTQHAFISIDFLTSIHARDIRIGRTDNFLVTQLLAGAGLFTLPLAVAGFVWLFTSQGKRYRFLAVMFIVPLVLFTVARGRNYYQAPAYPMLFAAGAAWLEQRRSVMLRGVTWAALIASAAFGIALLVPVAPVGSALWKSANNVSDDFREEIGWPELVKTVAGIRDSLPQQDRARLGIMAGNYGEAGAINLYGGAYGLPEAISGINSYWLRGYGDPGPQTLIVVGLSNSFLEGAFESCTLAGHISNSYGVMNEETTRRQDVFVCRRLRQPWPQFWKSFRYFG
jgi:4-amino-4-deoxy-L-arabinose transferase-like glycosyltransferase